MERSTNELLARLLIAAALISLVLGLAVVAPIPESLPPLTPIPLDPHPRTVVKPTLDSLLQRADLDPDFQRTGLEGAVVALGPSIGEELTKRLPQLATTAHGTAIARALARVEMLRALPAFSSLAASTDTDCRVVAVHGLAALRAQEAIGTLLELIGDDAVEVRLAVGDCLAVLDTTEPRLSVRKAVVALFEKSTTVPVRLRALECLVTIGGNEAGAVAAKGLRDWNADVRAASADAVGRIGRADEDASARLIELLNDSERNVVRHATLACGRLRLLDACPRLIEMLEDEDEVRRGDALWSLQSISQHEFPETVSRWREWWEHEAQRKKPSDD
jgi:HEAT repeat protein